MNVGKIYPSGHYYMSVLAKEIDKGKGIKRKKGIFAHLFMK